MQHESRMVEFEGPFTWFGGNGDGVFSQESVDHPGIYMWAVPLSGGYLVYYVGETGQSLRTRLKDHVKHYFSGMYRVYEPSHFAEGEKVLLWNGMWRDREEVRLAEFVTRLPTLAVQTARMLESMRIFLAPLDAPDRLRRRIEAAVARQLYATEGPVGPFQDDDIVYARRHADEEPVRVILSCPVRIHGLVGELEA